MKLLYIFNNAQKSLKSNNKLIMGSEILGTIDNLVKFYIKLLYKFWYICKSFVNFWELYQDRHRINLKVYHYTNIFSKV